MGWAFHPVSCADPSLVADTKDAQSVALACREPPSFTQGLCLRPSAKVKKPLQTYQGCTGTGPREEEWS